MKLDGFITDDQIADILETQVFEWIKTGHWSKGEFMRWCMVIQAREFVNGVSYQTSKMANDVGSL
jgi:hypothetical protein